MQNMKFSGVVLNFPSERSVSQMFLYIGLSFYFILYMSDFVVYRS